MMIQGILSSVKSQTYHTKLIKFADPLYDIQNYAYARINRKPEIKDRKLLQFLGTDWGRSIDPELWVNLWRQETRAHLHKQGSMTTMVVLCDDLRFDNEAKQILDLGGKILWIESDTETRKSRSPKTFSGTNHASENGIGKSLISLTVYNNQGLPELRKNIRYLIEEVL